MSSFEKFLVVTGFFTPKAISLFDGDFGHAFSEEIDDCVEPWANLIDPGSAVPMTPGDAIYYVVKAQEKLAALIIKHGAAIDILYDVVNELKVRHGIATEG